jgi:hypothetical protein
MAVILASTLLQRLRESVGAENDTHVTDAELYRALTSGVADTWDTILSNGIGTEGVKSTFLNSVIGQQEYAILGNNWRASQAAPLASALDDFYQVSRILVVEGDRLRPIERVNPSEQYTLSAPKEAAVIKMYYFPVAPTFTTGLESFDGINGWEEHTIMSAAIYIKAKKEDDTGQFRAKKREVEERMKKMANRLRDAPPRIVRRASPVHGYGYHGYGPSGYLRGYHTPYTASVRAYDLRGANLELLA